MARIYLPSSSPAPDDPVPGQVELAEPAAPAVSGPAEVVELAEPEAPAPPPAVNAPKAEWVAYAVECRGADPGEAEAMTKALLIEKFGG